MPSSFFVNNGGTTAARSTIADDLTASSNSKSDAQKLAINAEDAQFTLSDGTTTGNSALHYSAKAAASATSASGSASTATQQAGLANDAKLAAQTAKAEAVVAFGDSVHLTGDQTIAGAKTFSSSINVTGSVTASDGIYLGGTGAANKLDDYEEGTWTPSLSGSSYVSGGVKYGFYTKLGNLITATAVFDNTTITGGAATKITGLPFTVSTEGSQTRFPAFSSHAAGSATSGTTIGGGYAEQSTTNLILLQNNSTVAVTLVNGTLFIFITVIYRT